MATKTDTPSFSSSFGLMVSGAAAAVGLGNIWRFPAEVAKHGGGMYVLIYVAFTLLLGYPLVLAELALGRSKGKGSFGAFQGKWSFLGAMTTMICWIILTFYNVVTGWVAGYMIKSLSGELMQTQEFDAFFGTFKGDIIANLGYTFLVVALLIMINQADLQQGIERISKIAMPALLIIILGLVGFACTLDCAREGISFYLLPHWKDFSWKAVTSALSQSFVSLGVGSGILITYGSYTKKKENLPLSAGVIVLSDLLIAFLAGCFLFPLLFCQNADPQAQGPALTFIHLPLIFQKLGSPLGLFLGVLFFVLLLLAALTSCIGLVEVPSQYLQHRYRLSKKKSVWFVALTSYLVSVCVILSQAQHPLFASLFGNFDLMKWLSGISIDTFEPLSSYLFCLFVYSQWKRKGLLEGIGKSGLIDSWLGIYVVITITYIAPVVIALLLLMRLVGF